MSSSSSSSDSDNFDVDRNPKKYKKSLSATQQAREVLLETQEQARAYASSFRKSLFFRTLFEQGVRLDEDVLHRVCVAYVEHAERFPFGAPPAAAHRTASAAPASTLVVMEDSDDSDDNTYFSEEDERPRRPSVSSSRKRKSKTTRSSGGGRQELRCPECNFLRHKAKPVTCHYKLWENAFGTVPKRAGESSNDARRRLWPLVKHHFEHLGYKSVWKQPGWTSLGPPGAEKIIAAYEVSDGAASQGEESQDEDEDDDDDDDNEDE